MPVQTMTTFAHPHDPHAQEQGMTLRDHFAGLAMQAIRTERRVTSAGTIASEAYAIADAMLNERANDPDTTMRAALEVILELAGATDAPSATLRSIASAARQGLGMDRDAASPDE